MEWLVVQFPCELFSLLDGEILKKKKKKKKN
jgi:hypothetical protein